jgi:hypothetical protein
MRVLDVDSHIGKPEAMFATLESEFAPRRPVAVPCARTARCTS